MIFLGVYQEVSHHPQGLGRALPAVVSLPKSIAENRNLNVYLIGLAMPTLRTILLINYLVYADIAWMDSKADWGRDDDAADCGNASRTRTGS